MGEYALTRYDDDDSDDSSDEDTKSYVECPAIVRHFMDAAYKMKRAREVLDDGV